MTTVSAIATAAFNGVASAITDVIKTCTVTKTTQGAYNATTGAYAVTTTAITGRAVAGTQDAIPDLFPAWVVGPKDELFYLEGLSSAPAENDTLTIGAKVRTIKAVGDMVGSGSFYAVIAGG